MKRYCNLHILLSTLFIICLSCCKQPEGKAVNNTNNIEQKYLIKVCDSITDLCGYAYINGDTVIGIGKYQYCFTDTFRKYAFVVKQDSGIVAIDRDENVLYNVFLLDNGPDEVSEGLFRVVLKNKIGYADAITGSIVIQPQFDCAYPFQNGLAQVSTNCKTKKGMENTTWESN